MYKILSLCLLLMMPNSLSHAEIYRCVDASGTVIFAGNPTLVPADCKPEILEGFTPPVSTPDSQAAAQDRQAVPPPAAVAPEPSKQADNEADEALKNKADKLVEQFTTTRRNVFRLPLARDKLKARNDLKDIRQQKAQLLSEVERSGLSAQEKNEIRTTLSAITEAD